MRYAETLALDIRPGLVSRVAAALENISGLGLWVTETGPLNRIMVLRFAESLEQLRDARQALLAHVPRDVLVREEATSWRVVTPVLESGAYGSLYEWRCYEAHPDKMNGVVELFNHALVARETLSPLCCALVSLEGTPRFAHLWPYKDAQSRSTIRAEALKTGKWPPAIAPLLVRMENALLSPLPASAWY
ncbi:NIPSNAP family protein [Neokomagataea anthophila]|uniref:NIPSNAP family protein n=1 Tax=Neokomagataea anthophila TaxID=2826925 RepID=A0ABS5E3V5_9PROT|nr:NIPSNAP family protein [Neokomagataea anthophila]